MDARFYIAITEIVFSAKANDTKKKTPAGSHQRAPRSQESPMAAAISVFWLL
jgi:hypothetical protein